LGSPRLGAVGSAYATLSARIVMAVLFWMVIVMVIVGRERQNPSGLHDVRVIWDGMRMARLARLGMPAAVQLVLEVGVFMVAAVLAGRISAAALAANQVVLNVASFFFMVPLGLSSAAAVRVGQAAGRRDPGGIRRAGWVALALTGVIAGVVSLAIILVPEALIGLFSHDPAVSSVGVRVLMMYAAAQPFDAWQVVATGALRGVGDTRSPMFANLGYHWLIGLPLAYVLCFWNGWGVFGLWMGLSVSLFLVATTLVAVWWRASGTFAGEPKPHKIPSS
jgi:MATE family multidrug resistance protein